MTLRDRPLLSFIVPIYNRATLLPRAVESVLSQDSEGDVELVLVNDGSTDASADVMEGWRDDPRVQRLHNPRNLGLGATRNHGFDKARGAWVVLLDSDNAIEPGGVAVIRQAVLAADASILACWFGSRDSHGKPTVRHTYSGRVPGAAFSEIAFPGEHLGVIRTEVARAVRYPSIGTLGECPPCFWFGVARRGDFFVTSQIVHYYDTVGNDRMSTGDRLERRSQEFITCYELVRGESETARPDVAARMWAKTVFYRAVLGQRTPALWRTAFKAVRAAGVRQVLPYVALAFCGSRVASWALARRAAYGQ
jgi:glycosyltransferase involved in cell wall biosynthesis